LLSSGTIIVATSNRAPKDLNEVCSLLVNLFT
jgi:predicted ATPase